MATADLGSAEWERSKISAQDINMLKKMGFSKKENSLQFPKEESYPRPPIDYRLHQPTPNSILHVSIFITLCECFLGVQPNWALWKRIFCLRRNGSHNVAYNIGGVVICVRSDVEYFDVKFPDSVQGWRKKWLYIHEESSNPVEENIAPFDGEAKILRRRSWDAEATEAEKLETEALMTRIHELQNTRRNHPVLASLPPLPEGGEVEDRTVVNDDNQGTSRPASEVAGSRKSAASLEKEAESEATASTRSSLPIASPKSKRKRDEIADSGTSEAGGARARKSTPDAGKRAFDPYEAALVSSGDEDEDTPIDATARTSTSRTLVVSESRPDGDETSPPQQNIEHPPPVESPQASSPKRARVEPSKESIQFPGSSSTPSLDDPLMKEFIRLGTQFVGYRDHTKKLEGDLAEANKRVDALAAKLEQSEKARKKAEAGAKKAKEDVATVEELRKRLHDAETSLSENITQQSAREHEIVTRLESQCRRFVRRTDQEYELEGPEGDQLLDTLSLLEIHGDEARDGLTEAKIGLSRIFPYFFKKKEVPATFVTLAKCFSSQENLGLQLRQEGLKVGVEGTIALVADSQQDVDWAKVGDTEEMETKKWQALIKAAKPNAKKILAYLGYQPAPAPSSSKPEVK
ncbi:hypothetical protein QYE76_041813 [Lolium multiflorum]|uniref:Transposase (putative) gypsy type domain-containing protein n=1 Tax=Lolium multiflorum TaxID=4521 RepID=A0AAD8TE94_LOLMU|nr:hypothetical protein QYE76_041813 [Lolium multiflorum]